VLGPVLGGLLLAVVSWRWIFLVNLPIGVAGTVWGYVALHELSQPERHARLDVQGTIYFSGGLSCLLVALTESVAWGWTSPRILLLFAGFVVLEALFYLRLRNAEHPLIDPTLFRSRIYSFTVSAGTLETLAMFAVNFLVLYYLQAVKNEPPLRAALMALPFSVSQSVVGPIGGIISDRIGARLPATAGLIMQAFACLALTRLGPGSSYALLFFGILLLGCGAGLVWSANTSAAMGAAPANRLGIAGATMATFRQCGMVTSFALALAVAAATIPQRVAGGIFLGGSGASLDASTMAAFSAGMSHALFVSTGIVLLAAVLTVVAGDTAAARRRAQPAKRPVASTGS
jgi:MFS family permease